MKKNKKSIGLLLAITALIGISVASRIDTKVTKAESTISLDSPDSIELKYENNNWFIWIVSTKTDWPSDYSQYYNISVPNNYMTSLNTWDKIKFNDQDIRTHFYNGSETINMWQRPNRFSVSVSHLPETITSVTLEKGCQFPSYATCCDPTNIVTYVLEDDIEYEATKKDEYTYLLTKHIDLNYIDNSIRGMSVIPGYNVTQSFLIISLNDTDYADIKENGGNDYNLSRSPVSYEPLTNFATNISLNGDKLNFTNNNKYLVYYGNPNSVGIDFTKYASDLKEGDSLFIPEGTTFPSYSLLNGSSTDVYITTEDVTYIYKDGGFRKDMAVTKKNTNIENFYFVPGYDPSKSFLIIMLTLNDYDQVEENKGNDYKIKNAPVNFRDCSNFGYSILFNGSPINIENKELFLNYYGNRGGIGIEYTNERAALKDFDTFTFKQGTTFPSYQILKGNSDVIYEVQNEVTYTYYQDDFHICSCASSSYLSDELSHWCVCDICGSKLNEHSHEIVEGNKPATCEEDGFENCEYCSICGYVTVEGTVIPSLGHDFEGATYLFDEEYHWQECKHECGLESEKVPHVYEGDGKTCLVCGYTKNVSRVYVTNGYINASETNEFKPGTLVTIIANTPEDGMLFEGWYSNNEKVSDKVTYSFVIAENDITLEARYKQNTEPQKDPFADDEEDEPTSTGCGGSIASTSILVTLLSAMLLCFTKRKILNK